MLFLYGSQSPLIGSVMKYGKMEIILQILSQSPLIGSVMKFAKEEMEEVIQKSQSPLIGSVMK